MDSIFKKMSLSAVHIDDFSIKQTLTLQGGYHTAKRLVQFKKQHHVVCHGIPLRTLQPFSHKTSTLIFFFLANQLEVHTPLTELKSLCVSQTKAGRRGLEHITGWPSHCNINKQHGPTRVRPFGLTFTNRHHRTAFEGTENPQKGIIGPNYSLRYFRLE